MFLTRLGFDSKAVITGDTTQIDLPPEKTSGLVEASHVLADVDGIGFMRFTDADVVRHPLVQSIIRAYDRASGAAGGRDARSPQGADGAAQQAGGERSSSGPPASKAHKASAPRPEER